MDRNFFASLQREWDAQIDSVEARRVFNVLVQRETAIAQAPARDLGTLIDILDRRHGSATETSWTIVAALVRQLDESALVSLGLLIALVPTMVAIASRFRWGADGPWVDPEEFAADLLATTWDVLADLAGVTMAYPVHTIRRRVTGRLDRWRDRQARFRRREVPTSFDLLDIDHPDQLAGALLRSLALADNNPIPVLDTLARVLCETDQAVLDRDLVKLIYAHRVLGYPISELSTILGVGQNALEYRARRAEVLLCAS